MIKLTRLKTGETCYVAPDNICFFTKESNGTEINVGGLATITVSESPEEVTRKILEYKLAMVRYGALARAWAPEQDDDKTSRLNDCMEHEKYILHGLSGLKDKADE